MDLDAFLMRLDALPIGYWRGVFRNAPWSMTLERSSDGRRMKLYGEHLGGDDHVSFNLYVVKGEPRLKPCEMPVEKVVDFVLEFEISR